MIPFVIAIFLFVVFIALCPPQGIVQKNIIYVTIGFLLIVIAGFRTGDNDYIGYLENYKLVKRGASLLLVEPSFGLIASLVNTSLAMFVIYAFLGVSLKLIAIKQLTELNFLALVAYISYFFILHEMTQIRAGVASAFLLLCIKPIYDKNWKHFLLYAALAITFHYSAIIILPLWFLGNHLRKSWLLFSIPIAYFVYFLGFNLITILPIPGVEYRIEAYKTLQKFGDDSWSAINVFNILHICKVAIFYFLLWKSDLIVESNKYTPILMKIFCFSLMSFPVFAVMPVIAFRISEFYGVVEIFLIPMIYYMLKPKILSKIFVVLVCISFISVSIFLKGLVF